MSISNWIVRRFNPTTIAADLVAVELKKFSSQKIPNFWIRKFRMRFLILNLIPEQGCEKPCTLLQECDDSLKQSQFRP